MINPLVISTESHHISLNRLDGLHAGRRSEPECSAHDHHLVRRGFVGEEVEAKNGENTVLNHVKPKGQCWILMDFASRKHLNF